jgi:hypothetical protein
MGVVQVAVLEPTGRRILGRVMRKVYGLTRADCPRQLPTDHDYAASTREYLSDQLSQSFLDRNLDYLLRRKE